jgi:hypothetical protein
MSFQIHNTVLRDIFMPDELPSGDRAAYLFLEMISLAFVFGAVEDLLAGKLVICVVALACAVLFFLAAIHPRIIKGT